MTESWAPIADYPGYEVSDFGHVRSIERTASTPFATRRVPEIYVKPHKNSKGYLRARLSRNGDRRAFFIHRLVCSAFVNNPYELPQVNHIDGNKENNTAENLEWVSAAQNCFHRDHILAGSGDAARM